MKEAHGDDLEIEFAACRCSLPAEAADVARGRLEASSLRVAIEPAPDPRRRLLTVKQVVSLGPASLSAPQRASGGSSRRRWCAS